MSGLAQQPTEGAAPICPGCGYLRTGLAASARCPECGAEGVDGCLQLHGAVRSMRSATILAFGVACFLAIALLIPGLFGGPSLGACEAVAGLVSAGTAAALGRHLVRTHGGTHLVTTWTVHEKGIVVSGLGRQTLVPRDSIARLDCAESVFGPVTQVMVIRRVGSMSGALGRTHVLYLRGDASTRAELCERARAVLGLSRA